MQLIPGTQERFGVRDAFDAEANIKGGLAYLKMAQGALRRRLGTGRRRLQCRRRHGRTLRRRTALSRDPGLCAASAVLCRARVAGDDLKQPMTAAPARTAWTAVRARNSSVATGLAACRQRPAGRSRKRPDPGNARWRTELLPVGRNDDRNQRVPLTATKDPKSNGRQRGNPMKTIPGLTVSELAAVALPGLGGWSGMSAQDKSTAVGAVLIGGST